MEVIKNNFIPFKGFKCVNLFGVLFVHKSTTLNVRTIRHEEIHTAQMKELLYVAFYVIYFAEWLIKWAIYRSSSMADAANSFEKEAYWYQDEENYLSNRKHFAQWRKRK
jgi:hypothetical protein